MKFGRIFVTTVVVLASLGTVNCSRGERKDNEKKAQRQQMNKALITEGETLLTQVDALRKELDDNYKIIIADERVRVSVSEFRDNKTLGGAYNWGRLTLAQRQTAKERLASLATALTRIIEIDTKQHVYVTHLQKVLDRKASTESFQISLGNFEKQYGEQFDDALPANSPVYKNL